MKIYDYSYSAGRRGFSRIRVHKEGWTEGSVVTPHGFVDVYAQGDKKYSHITRIEFFHNGRLHVRSFKDKRYTPRGIVTKAKQFAKEIATKEAQ